MKLSIQHPPSFLILSLRARRAHTMYDGMGILSDKDVAKFPSNSNARQLQRTAIASNEATSSEEGACGMDGIFPFERVYDMLRNFARHTPARALTRCLYFGANRRNNRQFRLINHGRQNVDILPTLKVRRYFLGPLMGSSHCAQKQFAKDNGNEMTLIRKQNDPSSFLPGCAMQTDILPFQK